MRIHLIIDKSSFQEILKIISLGVDAEFIGKAVENHDKLVEALKELIKISKCVNDVYNCPKCMAVQLLKEIEG